MRSCPVEIRGEEVWVNLTPQTDPKAHQAQRLQDGLEQNISLVIAKAAIALVEMGVTTSDIFQVGLDFGCRYGKIACKGD
ncbi:hypothetical protein [Lyngbya confervoides]|uniref:Uncharacterized protein n=1 Tax=Lyngbya confervoides BDU141951 TaxID=1574623 RepID=A0ABD4T8G8_9CYAN|nr:hypothetical protein [Lyngbya confervoides]MCM1984877.1 hypothetical protein [Lyngbya confervoides BDU141951]